MSEETAVMDTDVDAILEERQRFSRTWDAISAKLEPGKAELDAMAHGLAYSFATAVVEGVSLAKGQLGAAGLLDLRVDWLPPAFADDFHTAVKYLDARGLLERDEEQPHVAHVRDESEATW